MYYIDSSESVITCILVVAKSWPSFIKKQSQRVQNWLTANQFTARSAQVCCMPDPDGKMQTVYVGIENKNDYSAIATLATKLPAGQYKLQGTVSFEAHLFWGLAQYRFSKYKDNNLADRQLLVSKAQAKRLRAMVDSINLVRDLINTPTEDMGSQHLAAVLQNLAVEHQAKFSELVGDELLDKNYPAIHTVGRASTRAPRLLRMRWGKDEHPLVCLVGKGVCFDTGGLDLKPSPAMRYMKKDMGGAAHVIGLAKLIMMLKLPIQIEVIVPAVENSVAGNAYRPGDVIATRKGLTVEIGNTDAEGRLVLADALTLASELKPVCIMDFATLTGAARVAVGTDIAAMFSNDQPLATQLQALGEKHNDPVWQLPLFQNYRAMIEPGIADLSNSGDSPFAGAITAALFLESFVKKNIPWIHFDVMAWNGGNRPGKPMGGEALGLRAAFAYLEGLRPNKKS